MKIEDVELDMNKHYLYKVTYVPFHADGNIQHEDCDRGVIINFNDSGVSVLYSGSRCVNMTNEENLVWG